MDIHNAACDGNLNDVCDSIRRGGDVNSVDEVSWFVGTVLVHSVEMTY